MNASRSAEFLSVEATGKRWRMVALILGAAVVLLIPFPTVMIAPMEVSVRNAAGEPVIGAIVRQVWLLRSASRRIEDGSSLTDRTGEVHLPRRVVTASLLQRAISSVRMIAFPEDHAPGRRLARLYVWAPGYQTWHREVERVHLSSVSVTLTSDPDDACHPGGMLQP